MLTVREEEIKMVVGGAEEIIGAPRFGVGDRVIAKNNPSMGVGTVEASKYNKGWRYFVRMNSGILYIPEGDLLPALM